MDTYELYKWINSITDNEILENIIIITKNRQKDLLVNKTSYQILDKLTSCYLKYIKDSNEQINYCGYKMINMDYKTGGIAMFFINNHIYKIEIANNIDYYKWSIDDIYYKMPRGAPSISILRRYANEFIYDLFDIIFHFKIDTVNEHNIMNELYVSKNMIAGTGQI